MAALHISLADRVTIGAGSRVFANATYVMIRVSNQDWIFAPNATIAYRRTGAGEDVTVSCREAILDAAERQGLHVHLYRPRSRPRGRGRRQRRFNSAWRSRNGLDA